MEILNILQQEFFLRALIGGILVAATSGILGVMLTLKGESLFAEAIAHSSLAGIAIGLVLGGFPLLGGIFVAIIMSLLLTYLSENTDFDSDILLGILFPFFFSLGLIIISLDNSYRADLTSYLFGNLLLISWNDVLLSFFILIFTLSIYLINYKRIAFILVSPVTSAVKRIPISRFNYFINIFTAVLIVIAVKFMGIILVTGILVIPAASARLLATKFSQLVPLSSILAMIFVFLGMTLGYSFPTGPAIVFISTIIFGLILITTKLSNKLTLTTS